MRQLSKKCNFIAEEYSSIGSAKVMKSTFLIGAHSYIRSGCIDNVEQIGRFCSIGLRVNLGQDPNNHPLYWASTHNKLTGYTSDCKGLVLGNDVWIGDDVTVMSGIKIGDGAVVGAGAVVTKNVEPYQVVVGIPAKVIKDRFDEDIKNRIQKSEWWNKSYFCLSILDFSDIQLFLSGLGGVKDNATYNRVQIKNRKITPLQ